MLQINILSGKMAGTSMVARRFPFQIGRSAHSDLSLEEPGVWDDHLEIKFEPGDGFFAGALGDALITVNGEAVQHQRIRNGARIELGGAVLQFWLGETTQRGLRLHEWFAWGTVLAVTAIEVYLIAWLF